MLILPSQSIQGKGFPADLLFESSSKTLSETFSNPTQTIPKLLPRFWEEIDKVSDEVSDKGKAKHVREMSKPPSQVCRCG